MNRFRCGTHSPARKTYYSMESVMQLHVCSWEFHVSRWARDHYQFDEALFAFNGNVILADLAAARTFAQKMNDKKDLAQFPEQAVKAGQLNALGLLDELLHALVAEYRREVKA